MAEERLSMAEWNPGMMHRKIHAHGGSETPQVCRRFWRSLHFEAVSAKTAKSSLTLGLERESSCGQQIAHLTCYTSFQLAGKMNCLQEPGTSETTTLNHSQIYCLACLHRLPFKKSMQSHIASDNQYRKSLIHTCEP